MEETSRQKVVAVEKTDIKHMRSSEGMVNNHGLKDPNAERKS